MNRQLTLNLRLRASASFDNFCISANRVAIDALRTLVAPSASRTSAPAFLFLWGEAATGKSHLLQAACRDVQARGDVALYIPFGDPDVTPDVLEEAEHAALVCLDDVHRVAGISAWEIALFRLYERARSSGARLVAAANRGPSHLGIQLPDLATRLGWGPVFQLMPLADEDKPEALRLRAQAQGLAFGSEVARYILNRYPRDLHSLFRLIDRIDRASLASQRRITIPFIQEIEQSRDLN